MRAWLVLLWTNPHFHCQLTPNPSQDERPPQLHPQQRGCLPKVRPGQPPTLLPKFPSSKCRTSKIRTHQSKLNESNRSRNRLPSLYSDFTLQKRTNPDGYAVNVAAWEQALNHAARRGYTSSRGVRRRSGSLSVSASSTAKQSTGNNNPSLRKKTDHLVLRTDESLLRDLESPEWGRPVALGAVFVCFFPFVLLSLLCVSFVHTLEMLRLLISLYCPGRGIAQTYHGCSTGL